MNKLPNLKSATRLAVCLTVLLVAGCSEITPQQLRNAEISCEGKNGIYLIQANLLRRNMVFCGDESYEFIESVGD